MTRRVVRSARLREEIAQRLDQEAAETGMSSSALLERAIEQYLSSDASTKLHILRSIFVVRELIWDMSPRTLEEKEKLWQSMHEFAQSIVGQELAEDTL